MYWKFCLLEVWPPFLKNSRRSLATFKLFVLRHFDLIERSLVVGDDPIFHHIAHAAYDLAFGSQHQGITFYLCYSFPEKGPNNLECR